VVDKRADQAHAHGRDKEAYAVRFVTPASQSTVFGGLGGPGLVFDAREYQTAKGLTIP
jgi:hypothetical protein